MLKDNLKLLRQKQGLSQEELSQKLHVVRQTVSKWESGRSVPDAEQLMKMAELFEAPASEILGVDLAAKEKTELQIITEKLEALNAELVRNRAQKRKHIILGLAIADVAVIAVLVLLVLLGSPYQDWDYADPEWSVIGTFWHSFEWIFFKIAPFLIVILTGILVAMLMRGKRKS